MTNEQVIAEMERRFVQEDLEYLFVYTPISKTTDVQSLSIRQITEIFFETFGSKFVFSQ